MNKINNIYVKNASANNLKNVSVTLEPNHFYVFAGPSGSGKSSLAFDVLYTEAERLGKARGLKNVFRQRTSQHQVENLPEMTIGVEQQIESYLQTASIGWYSGLLNQIVTQNKNQEKKNDLWCPSCHGHGYIRSIDPKRVVRNDCKPVTKGAFTPAVKKVAGFDTKWWKPFCADHHLEPDTPFNQLPEAIQELLLKGNGKDFQGFERGLLDLIGADSLPKQLREEFPYYVNRIPCENCEGLGISEPSLQGGIRDTLENLVKSGVIKLADYEKAWLYKLELASLRMDYPVFKLSTMQARRLRFFCNIIGLSQHSLIIFDEPCAGLSLVESRQMGDLFIELARRGHTMLAIEHSPALIAMADRVVAFGPGSGNEGGAIVYQGTPKPYLEKLHNFSKESQPDQSTKKSEATQRFLQATFTEWFSFSPFEFNIPVGQLVCVCGPSGSGKSAFLEAVFATCDKTPVAWQARLKIKERKGEDYIRRPHKITSEPIGKHPGSTPATFLGVWDNIRKFFAQLPTSKKQGLDQGHFSFNSVKGRCQKCLGHGYLMNDGYDICQTCHGTRYKNDILSVSYQKYTVANINTLTVKQTTELFHDESTIVKYLSFLEYVGLDYLVLGQPSNSLSGGEAQRIKIASQLCKRLGDRSFYILDVPSRGLDNTTLLKLYQALRILVEKNNSVLIAENNPELAIRSDWLIMLGLPKSVHSNVQMEIRYSGPTDKCPPLIWREIMGDTTFF
jgi:excinuclease ABC subunit A